MNWVSCSLGLWVFLVPQFGSWIPMDILWVPRYGNWVAKLGLLVPRFGVWALGFGPVWVVGAKV